MDFQIDHDLFKHWKMIETLFAQAFNSSKHFALATVGEDGMPHVAPVGSFCLTEPGHGFFFELFLKRTAQNLDRDPHFSVLAVHSGQWYWFRSIFGGKFKSPPAIRLHGIATARREATPLEVQMFRQRIRPARIGKGYDLLWKDLKVIREVTFQGMEPVNLGSMSQELWR